MQEKEFPALYLSANDLSITSQKRFFLALKSHLILLVVAAVLSVVSIPHWSIAVVQVLSLLGALSCSIYLYTERPDRLWYAGRAVAESIKTITWRYVCRAEPFQVEDTLARREFQRKLKAIVDQNKDVAQSLSNNLGKPQITEVMTKMRAQVLGDRKSTYTTNRIKDQLHWYANKSTFNRKTSSKYFIFLILINIAAVISAVVRVKFISTPFWPTDIFVAGAASLLSWMQANRFSELAASYAVATHEISLILDQSTIPDSDESFSLFVGDSENAFSREHTLWIARKDA
jgi:hypothetical protein